MTIDLSKATYPDLLNHRVVIIGGTGSVGEGIVRAWLKTGAQVVIPSRTDSKVDRFREIIADGGAGENLHFATGDYTSFDGASAMAQKITQEFGPVTDVIASIGGWWQGKPLWEVSEQDWQKYFVDLSTAHVASVRAWIPHLPASGSYQLILGGSATTPVPGASIINMEQAGLLMMRKVLSAEAGDHRRITSMVLGPVISRMRHQVDPDWVSNNEVGLVTAGVAASKTVTDVDYFTRSKVQMREVLQDLGLYPK